MILGRRTWGLGLKEVEAGGNDVTNPYGEDEDYMSVVQTSVEVTESSLSCMR